MVLLVVMSELIRVNGDDVTFLITALPIHILNFEKNIIYELKVSMLVLYLRSVEIKK